MASVVAPRSSKFKRRSTPCLQIISQPSDWTLFRTKYCVERLWESSFPGPLKGPGLAINFRSSLKNFYFLRLRTFVQGDPSGVRIPAVALLGVDTIFLLCEGLSAKLVKGATILLGRMPCVLAKRVVFTDETHEQCLDVVLINASSWWRFQISRVEPLEHNACKGKPSAVFSPWQDVQRGHLGQSDAISLALNQDRLRVDWSGKIRCIC